jgi:uncharacterized membrane protein YbhN (UPF0104 family)
VVSIAEQLKRSTGSRAATVAAAAFCVFAVLAGLAAIAGWHQVVDNVRPRASWWFAVALLAETASFSGYVLCYRAVARIRNGPRLSWAESIRLVATGFGAFLAKGGAALDAEALRPPGSSKAEGEARVIALDALEHAPLAPAACAASITLLAQGSRKPPLDFTIPWATLVPLGAALAYLGVRHRDRFQGKSGWRGWLCQVLYGIELLFQLAADLRTNWPAFAGATIYWAGDVICLWACLQPFHAAPAFAAVVIAHAAGYVLTRRTLPLAGAGIVELLMPLTLTAAGAPLTGAILGVLAYRIYNLWLPLVPALLARPRSQPS